MNVLDLFDKKLTVFEIAEITGIEHEQVKQTLLEAGQVLPPRDKKYRIIRTVPLNAQQKELITGCLLGRGGLMPHDTGFRFSCGHLEIEKELLLWKKGIMGNLTNALVKHNKYPAYFFRTSIHHELNNFKKLFYSNNKKVIPENISNLISPLALAAWTSDVGWINKTFNMRFQTSNYSYEEHLLLKAMLKTYAINSKICEYVRDDVKYYFISLNKRNALNFYEIIKLHHHWPIRNFAPQSQRLYV